MALDKNLFTLNIDPSKVEPSAIDLVDPSGTVHYRKRIIPNDAGSYMFSLSDPVSDSLLATVTAPSAISKEKVIELHNPSVTVPLSFKGTLTFKWTFTWEKQEYHWKREECYMVRKPDPPVLVAITKEPPGKIKTSVVQILDYNLNRFDIDDRKGLEIVLLTSLLTFSDHSEQLRAKPSDTPAVNSLPNVRPPTNIAPPPAPPPKPEGWAGDQIAILQAKEQRDINEVVIGEAGSVDDYAKHCCSLLNDDTLLFITLRSQNSECVSKVVQVAEATKRTRYKNGAWDEDLHQYVSTEDEVMKGKGRGPPRVINLDDNPAGSSSSSKSYKPPVTLTIHLSKIAMPELEPRAKSSGHSRGSSEPQAQRQGKKSSPAPLLKPPSGSPPSRLARSSSPPPAPRPSLAPHSDSSSQPPRSKSPRSPNSNSPQFPPLHTQSRHSSAPPRPVPHNGGKPTDPPPHYNTAYSRPPAGHNQNGFVPSPGPAVMNAPYTSYSEQSPQPPRQATSSGGFLDKFIRK